MRLPQYTIDSQVWAGTLGLGVEAKAVVLEMMAGKQVKALVVVELGDTREELKKINWR